VTHTIWWRPLYSIIRRLRLIAISFRVVLIMAYLFVITINLIGDIDVITMSIEMPLRKAPWRVGRGAKL